MNRAIAWKVAGAGRRTRDAAEEAARRAGMRLDDWLDEAIADQAAVEAAQPEDEDWLDAVAGRLELISRRNAQARDRRAPGAHDLLDSAITRLERRLLRMETRTAHAFDSIAQILERDGAALSGDRQSPLESAEAPEAVEGILGAEPTSRLAAELERLRREFTPAQNAPAPKPRSDLKAAVSQIAMRRHELNARGASDTIRADSETAAFDAGRDGAAPAPGAPNPGEPEAGATEDSGILAEVAARDAEARFAPPSQDALRDDIQAIARNIEDMRGERADERACAVDLGGLRAEIAAMSQSLADLAPRNAVIALEGAISDLVQRVEMMRRSGHGETMLAPLDAVAAELKAVVKAHDPQPIAAGLEREIRAIGGKIDGLAAATIPPEAFEGIRRQTEEVRDLLASAASRTAPLERMERQIGELADRVEQLGASSAPQVESAQMTALLVEARQQIESSTRPEALLSIEHRLEQIAARLDQEIARPAAPVEMDLRPFDELARRIDDMRHSLEERAPAEVDSGAFDELARRIDSVRQSLEERPAAGIDMGPFERLLRDVDAKLDAGGSRNADVLALQSILAEISGKLDRVTDPEISAGFLKPVLGELSARLEAGSAPLDLRPIESLLRALEAKIDAGPAPISGREIGEHVAEEVARRLRALADGEVDARMLAEQIAKIHNHIDALAGKAAGAGESEPAVRELIERLRAADAAPRVNAPDISAAIHSALTAHLSELKAEQASADRRTQARFEGLQAMLEALVGRLASIESELAGDVDDELRPPFGSGNIKAGAGSTLPGVEALGPEVTRPGSRAGGEDDDAPSPSASGEDFLIEPGAGAPQRALEARELAQAIGQRTNPAIGAHIAAARRAAQAALAESGGPAKGSGGRVQAALDRAPIAARSVANARAFYSSHKRTVLLGVALVIAATLAVRLVGVRAPFLQRSETDGQPVKAAKVDTPPARPLNLIEALKSIGRAIDAAPTGSIIAPGVKSEAPVAPDVGVPPPGDMHPPIPTGIPPVLRDAVSAGSPSAEYELALRLFEGRGAPKDPQAAALWFERAATLGFAPAQYRLAALYEKGIGVAADAARAKRWYLKAAEAGNARAAHNLAVMNAEPAGEKPDYGEAVKWFRRAAELGVRDSQYNLAILYARGLGVDQDLRQSWMWFSLAAQQGDADAGQKRDEVAAKMDPASLAAGADALAKFKPMKPDPAANEAPTPPGGWDAKQGGPLGDLSPSSSAGGARP